MVKWKKLEQPDELKKYLKSEESRNGKINLPESKSAIEGKYGSSLEDIDWQDLYDDWDKNSELDTVENLLRAYNSLKPIIPDTKITAPDLDALLRKFDDLTLRKGKNEPLSFEGILVSYIASNLVQEKEVTLKINEPYKFLGCLNDGKDLYVKGNVGDYLGAVMKSGSIKVEGTAGKFAGELMEGGSIVLEKNAEDWLGYRMKEGKITLRGNTGNYAGKSMTGGEIYVSGTIGSIGKSFGGTTGKIYQNGELVFENGHEVRIWKRT